MTKLEGRSKLVDCSI